MIYDLELDNPANNLISFGFENSAPKQIEVIVSDSLSEISHFWKIRFNAPNVNKLYKNYPNPFNLSNNRTESGTAIRYDLTEPTDVKLDVYNVKGQKIVSLVNEFQEINLYKINWNGKDSSEKSVSSGIYFYRLKTNNFEDTKRMILVK